MSSSEQCFRTHKALSCHPTSPWLGVRLLKDSEFLVPSQWLANGRHGNHSFYSLVLGFKFTVSEWVDLPSFSVLVLPAHTSSEWTCSESNKILTYHEPRRLGRKKRLQPCVTSWSQWEFWQFAKTCLAYKSCDLVLSHSPQTLPPNRNEGRGEEKRKETTIERKKKSNLYSLLPRGLNAQTLHDHHGFLGVDRKIKGSYLWGLSTSCYFYRFARVQGTWILIILHPKRLQRKPKLFCLVHLK